MEGLFIVTYSLFLLISDCLCDFQIMQMRIKAGKTDRKILTSGVRKTTYSITEVVILEIKLFYFQSVVLLHLPFTLHAISRHADKHLKSC